MKSFVKGTTLLAAMITLVACGETTGTGTGGTGTGGTSTGGTGTGGTGTGGTGTGGTGTGTGTVTAGCGTTTTSGACTGTTLNICGYDDKNNNGMRDSGEGDEAVRVDCADQPGLFFANRQCTSDAQCRGIGGKCDTTNKVCYVPSLGRCAGAGTFDALLGATPKSCSADTDCDRGLTCKSGKCTIPASCAGTEGSLCLTGVVAPASMGGNQLSFLPCLNGNDELAGLGCDMGADLPRCTVLPAALKDASDFKCKDSSLKTCTTKDSAAGCDPGELCVEGTNGALICVMQDFCAASGRAIVQGCLIADQPMYVDCGGGTKGTCGSGPEGRLACINVGAGEECDQRSRICATGMGCNQAAVKNQAIATACTPGVGACTPAVGNAEFVPACDGTSTRVFVDCPSAATPTFIDCGTAEIFGPGATCGRPAGAPNDACINIGAGGFCDGQFFVCKAGLTCGADSRCQ